jgi:hypothetical protein
MLFNASAPAPNELEKGTDGQLREKEALGTVTSPPHPTQKPFWFSTGSSAHGSPIPKSSDFYIPSPHPDGGKPHSFHSTPSDTSGSSVQSDSVDEFQEIALSSHYAPNGPRAWIVTRESAILVPAPVDPARLSALGIVEGRSHSQSSLYTIAEASHENSSATTPRTLSPPNSADSTKQTF